MMRRCFGGGEQRVGGGRRRKSVREKIKMGIGRGAVVGRDARGKE